MKKKEIVLTTALLAAVVLPVIIEKLPVSSKWLRPTSFAMEKDEEFEKNADKFASWSAADAARNQALLEKYMGKRSSRSRGFETFANGQIQGEWINRAPINMPGAFKFAEMLDGTDTVYGVTWNHYADEYNSKSTIFKGTVYNAQSGTKGDDFKCITAHWPNRYKNFYAFKYNGTTRLIAGIESGSVYWSDDDGATWTKSTGVPSSVYSTAVARGDGNKVYSTDGNTIYRSTDGGATFTSFQTISGSGAAVLYSPRYPQKQGDSTVYFARGGTFYALTPGGSSFVQKGSYGSSGSSDMGIGGDKRKLYVTESKKWFVSTNGGSSFTEKFPKDNWYGGRTDPMSMGAFVGSSPAHPDTVIGAYGQPVFSKDGFNTHVSSHAKWGYYQGGYGEDVEMYRNRIRFNFHPDFQCSQFFYNSNDKLLSIHSTDGGLFISYSIWRNMYEGYDWITNGYSSDYINITTLNTPTSLIYRSTLFTGYKDEKHLVYATQDQGSHQFVPGTSGATMDMYQAIGGDGPTMISGDGKTVWEFSYQGDKIYNPTQLYDQNGNMRFINSVKEDMENGPSVSFGSGSLYDKTHMYWAQAYVDKKEPGKRMWTLTKTLNRATWNGSSVQGHTISKGSNQVAAIAQSAANNNNVWFLQDGKVFKSTNYGDSFDNGTATPFAPTSNTWGHGDIGGGWVLPGNDNWILFAGPSANSVGAILSKDGGATWANVTGNLPYGTDFQVGGMVGTPDGKFVFAGTDIGPWVFVVAEEKWYPMGQVSGYFNTTSIEYYEPTKTVRFGTWGQGVWDFVITENTGPFLNVTSPFTGSLIEQGSAMTIAWKTNQSSAVKIELMSGATVAATIGTGKTGGSFTWTVPENQKSGSYTIRISEEKTDGLVATSGSFSITEKLILLPYSRMSIESVSSEETASENGRATNLIDNNPATIWHTNYSTGADNFPHSVVFKSDTTVPLKGFAYLPRTDGTNGTVTSYKIEVSSNGSSWNEVAAGEWAGTGTKKVVVFAKAVWGSYVRFTALAESNGAAFASGSEVTLYYIDDHGVAVVNPKTGTAKLAITGITGNNINLTIPSAGTYRVQLFMLNGKQIVNSEYPLRQGGNVLHIGTDNLAGQVVMMRISGSGGELRHKIRLY